MAVEQQGEAKPGAYEALTHKQRRFVDAYFELGFNATQAALAAGYSERTARQQGSRLLTDVDIKAAIAEQMKLLAMASEEVLARLAAQARTDMGDFLTIVPYKLPVYGEPEEEGGDPPIVGYTDHERIELDLIAAKRAGRTSLIKSLSHTMHGPRIELYDAQAALVQLGKHHGLFKEQPPASVEVTVNVNDSRNRLAHLVNRHAAPGGEGGDSGGVDG